MGCSPTSPQQPPHLLALGRDRAYPNLTRELPPAPWQQQAGLRWAAAPAVGCIHSQAQSTAPARETTALCPPAASHSQAYAKNTTVRTKCVVCRTPTFCVVTDAPHCTSLYSREGLSPLRPPSCHQHLAAAAHLYLHSGHACRAF